MEEKKKKKFPLNFFDIIIILIAVLLIAFVYYIYRSYDGSTITIGSTSTETVRYTIEMTSMPEGSSELISIGDTIMDSTKNYGMGTVVSIETVPYTTYVTDLSTGTSKVVEIEGYETINLTIESSATVTDSSIVTDGGFTVKVGLSSAAEGPGYAGSGYIIAIER